MYTINLTMTKSDIYNEVAKTTAYIGASMQDPAGYDRVSTTDENAELLDRFFNESLDTLSNKLKRQISTEIAEDDDRIGLELYLPNSSGAATLRESIHRGVFSFFVNDITAKWMMVVNRNDLQPENYSALAAMELEEVSRMVYHKVRPQRPTY